MDSSTDASRTGPALSSREPEPLASYSIQRRQERSISDSTVSPTASTEMSETNSSDDGLRRRPLHERRPYSDYGQIHRKIKVQTIAEDTVQQLVPPDEPSQLSSQPPRKSSSPFDHRASASTSSRSFEAGPSPVHKKDTSSGSDGRPQVSSPSTRPGLGRTWSRTKSGSVWYERLRSSPDKSKDSLPATVGDVAPQLLIPLPPPKLPPGQAGPPYRHLVRVEKSFTKPKAAPTSAGEPPETSSPASRKSSINPRQLFSVPLQLVRRLSFSRRKPKVKSLRSLSPSSMQRSQRLADHKSVLKRNRTSEALRRVNSLLKEANILTQATSSVSVINRIHVRSMSVKSSSSKGSAVQKSKSKSGGGSDGKKDGRPRSGEMSRETPESASYTSSQLALRMGAQPNNTPDEKATYKIKRSPSAETEEFLKVDISVRGGTSYLPSEARRIHTPPLPQDGPDGKKRGFFFDYNAPRRWESRPDETLDPAAIPARSTSRSSTVGKRAFLSAGRIVTRPKTNDWYDTQLAQLEELEDDASRSKTAAESISKNRSVTQASLSEVRQWKEEETLDMTIPEHLPSSPLCPRHPRYWRIVKGKGSQFDGCWMHGVGPWDDPVNFK